MTRINAILRMTNQHPKATLCGAGLALAFCLLGSTAHAQLHCPGNADALGTERVLTVDAATTPRVGRKHFPQTLPLAPKEVVLTFDDGPLPGTTTRVLDALKRDCVRASFFLLGRNALANRELARRELAEGHTVAHHTHIHPLLNRMPVAAAEAEIDRGFAAVDTALYGEAGRKGTELALERRKMKIHSQGTVERNTVAVEEAAKAIHASQPDAVVMVSAYTSIAAFVRAMQKLGSGATFYNVSFVGSKALSDALGKDGVGVAISQVVPFPWGTAVPVVKEYQSLAKKAGFTDYNFSALEGFLTAKVMVEALRRAGKNPTREGLVEALEKMSDVDLGGFFIGYSPQNRAGSKFVDLTIISRDGKFLR